MLQSLLCVVGRPSLLPSCMACSSVNRALTCSMNVRASRAAHAAVPVPDAAQVAPRVRVHAPPPASVRRQLLSALIVAGVTICAPEAANAALKCPGLNGYELKQCLRDLRAAREAGEGEDGQALSVEDQKLQTRQYEQPGTLVTLPSGVQYRELDEGLASGLVAQAGSVVEIQYTVYRLASGAYFKYSSGGTPVLLWALGSGFEGQDDLDSVYRFTLGEPGSLPRAATPAVMGMRAGGRRRILIPPQAGWVDGKVQPQPNTFGGQRRLAAHRDEPLLFEVLVKRVLTQGEEQAVRQQGAGAGVPRFAFPAPPSPFKDKLGPQATQ